MLESNPDTKAILVHTIQEASLADRQANLKKNTQSINSETTVTNHI